MIESVLAEYESFSWAMALGITVIYIIGDALYAQYTLSVSEYHPASASNASALIHLMYALGVLSYVGNYLYIIPIAVGSWLGTYIVVYYKKRREMK